MTWKLRVHNADKAVVTVDGLPADDAGVESKGRGGAVLLLPARRKTLRLTFSDCGHENRRDRGHYWGVNVNCELLDALGHVDQKNDYHGLSYDGGGLLTLTVSCASRQHGAVPRQATIRIESNGGSSNVLTVAVRVDERTCAAAVRRALLLVWLRRKIAAGTAARSVIQRVVDFEPPFDFLAGSVDVSRERRRRW